MRAIHVVGFALPVLAAGCAWQPKPTPQLAQAQQAYAEAASGPAAQNAPRELKEARDSLQRAIRADRAGDTDRVKFAELARSRALLANQQAYTALAREQQGLANEQLAQTEQIRRKLVGQAQQQRQELQQREAQLQQMQQQLHQQTQEQQRREQQLRQVPPAEGRTLMQPSPALMRLADRSRAVPAGTQLVFSSGMQFENKQATLTPQAQHELDQIAEALQSTPGATIVVDGFADSMGSDEMDRRMSTARAEAVAGYLGSHGVPRNNIQTRGLGSSRAAAGTAPGGGGAPGGGAEVIVTVPRTGATEMQPSGPSGAQPGVQQPSGVQPPSRSGVEQQQSPESPGAQPPSGTESQPDDENPDGP